MQEGDLSIHHVKNLSQNKILDDGCHHGVGALGNCAVESLPTLVILPVDHRLRLRPGDRRKHFGPGAQNTLA